MTEQDLTKQPLDEDPTIGKLVYDASQSISKLVQGEIALAKSELQMSAKAGGIGAALFAVAGFILLLSLIFLSVAAAYFISMTGLHLAWCFLIVFGVHVFVALILALVGFLNVKKVKGPEKAIEQAKQTKAALSKSKP